MQLHIQFVLDDNGLISVNADGPASDNFVSIFGLIEMGKAALLQKQAEQQQAQQQPKRRSGLLVPNGPMPGLRS